MTYTDRYDDLIRAAMAQHLPMLDWRWGNAQLIAESNLDPLAESKAGAQGIAQFMPDTWHEVAEELWPGEGPSPFDPQFAILAYAYYMRSLWDEWRAPRPWLDRLRLTQASYNAGLGNLIHAQRLARRTGEWSPPNDYASISECLWEVTGAANAKQTIDYVERIGRIYDELCAQTGAAVPS